MRIIRLEETSKKLTDLVTEEDPVDEDIGLLDQNENLCGVIIPKEAYDFFLRKVEEEEDRLDADSVEAFRQSGEKDQ